MNCLRRARVKWAAAFGAIVASACGGVFADELSACGDLAGRCPRTQSMAARFSGTEAAGPRYEPSIALSGAPVPTSLDFSEQPRWVSNLAVVVGGYKAFESLRAPSAKEGARLWAGQFFDRLELLPIRPGPGGGSKGLVGISLYSCRGHCSEVGDLRSINVSLAFDNKGDGGQKQLVLGARMSFK